VVAHVHVLFVCLFSVGTAGVALTCWDSIPT
jgi:hypothetical protein